ncbi:MAG: BCCT family transporter [Cyclobacterium sp.]|uniref:BCCT family transporter n=1 Tax=Cyclobacterium sp. SYSU L10401 TaxID=2678657 RepID=UPI0021CE5714|nr:BCCT family transporter [Cyclobacterium sp. SYSU L10401]
MTPTSKPTFLASLLACLIFLLMAFSFPVGFKAWIEEAASFTLDYFGTYYLYLGLLMVLALMGIAVSPLGKYKLGEGPVAYGWFSWAAMLYSTGMGAGLMLRAIQEPVFYYTQAPRASALSPEIFALEYTFFHWGLTPWAFYGMFGLIIGFLVYGKGRLMLSSSVLHGKYHRPWLIVPIDVITIISTLFGVVGAVGLGSRQLLAGFRELFGMLDVNYTNNAYVVVFLGSLATLSAFTGLSNGIRNLSRFNILLALFLMVFTWLAGDVLGVFGNFYAALASYLKDFLPMSINFGAMKVAQDFLMDWTFFYWAFWLSWAPFTGVFIARISKGRSFREFIFGVLLVPSLGTFFWFTVFGTQAFELIGNPEAYEGQFDSLYGSIFVFFDSLPQAGLIKLLGLILVFTFLITSIDSAIYVLGIFADNGNMEPKRRNLLGWGVILVLFTVATIFVGKEQLLESISQMLVLMALPFSWVYLLMISSFLFILFQKK